MSINDWGVLILVIAVLMTLPGAMLLGTNNKRILWKEIVGMSFMITGFGLIGLAIGLAITTVI